MLFRSGTAVCGDVAPAAFAVLEPPSAPAIPLTAAIASVPENPNNDAAAEAAPRNTVFNGDEVVVFEAESNGAGCDGAAVSAGTGMIGE